MEEFDVLDENGRYTNKIASRDECHEKGLWHKAVVVFIVSNDNKKVLLQQRSASKKFWPNLWDITAGGHVLAGELSYQTAIRETKEEISLDVDQKSLEFIGATRSENLSGDIINRHFNEYYIVHADVNADDLTLQETEVQDIQWFDQGEIMERIKNHYDGLTEKEGCWEYLVKYFELTNSN